MKTSNKYLLFNRYVVMTFFLPLCIAFFSWAIFSEYFSAVFIWDLSELNMTREEYFKEMFKFHNYPIDGFALIQLILPIFPMLFTIPFLHSKKMFLFSYPRSKSYKSTILSAAAKHILYGSFVLFISYVTFLFVGVALLPIVEDPGVSRELFSDILGNDFYVNNVILYFVLEGFIKFFIFPIVYSLFAVSVSFLTPKIHLSVIIPIAYYAILAIVVAVLESAFAKLFILFLSPTYTVMSSSRPYINTFLVFAPLLPPLVFSVGVLIREFTKKKKRGDVFAVI